jgi:hypothetical protein
MGTIPSPLVETDHALPASYSSCGAQSTRKHFHVRTKQRLSVDLLETIYLDDEL